MKQEAVYIYDDVDRIDNFISLMRNSIQNDVELKKEMNITKLCDNATYGDQGSKEKLINLFTKYINTQMRFSSEKKVDELIKKYYVNGIIQNDRKNDIKRITYFDKIYESEDDEFDNIVNIPCIKENSPYKKKIRLLAQIAYQELYGLSILDPYIYNNIEKLNEISINDYNFIVMQINGKKRRIKNLKFESIDKYKKIIHRSIPRNPSNTDNQNLTDHNPESLTTNLSGVRITAVIPPYGLKPSINLRFSNSAFVSKENLIQSGTSTEYIERFIDIIMHGRPNIFVIGGQGSGKTNYIRRLIGSIPEHLGILTIESQFELNIPKYFPNKDVKSLRFSNLKTARDCFETGLRLNRDIIIDGEVRTIEEAYITLEAMTRQNRGSMGSFHTSSNEDFIYDYKNLLMEGSIYKNAESAFYDIARAVDLLIYFNLDEETGKRSIGEVSEVQLVRDNYHKPFKLNTLFEYDYIEEKMYGKNRISQAFLKRAMKYEFNKENLDELNALYEEIGMHENGNTTEKIVC